ncbi:MAG TPA: BadF/BadG/BcrA/BcrD ATPase family protein [Gemmatimonadaceae bacterium]|jgi:glucosamine kinase|nr:BadF/BadG/BcrA/BcrD ATPase family protein [Gemmatimonadaceae bacterium]
MTFIVIGIDGGGSKTHAIVADEQGKTIAETVGPGSAVRPGKAEHSANVIADVVRDALASCEMTHVTPRVLAIGVAGAGREAERQELWQALVSRDLASELVIHSDFSIALDDAFGDGPGVLLISGTGSVAFGRSPTGATARCGGWGPVCGDEGSGAWIGRKALTVVTSAADGREPETALTGAILTAAQVNETADLVGWAANAPPSQIATLAPVVLSVADAGDLRANALVSIAVEELVLHVRSLARQLFGDERAALPVALSGGMLSRGTTLRKRLEHRLKSAVPGAAVRSETVVAARGAVRAALRIVGEAMV